MSHIVRTTANIEDIAQLRRAALILGVPIVENATPRYYYTGAAGAIGHEAEVCDLVLKLPGRYDLGVKIENGKARFVCDSELLHGNYGRGSEGRRIVGEDAVNLYTAYEEAGVQLMCEREGLTYSRVVEGDAIAYYVNQ